jgi:putative transport protein
VSALQQFLESVPLAGLMLVITLGYSLGRASIRGVSLGPAGATLFIALLLGHLGLSSTPDPHAASLGSFGFALFIYSVGFDAAPRFLSSLLSKRGWRFVAVGVAVNLIAIGVTLLAARIAGLSGSTAAGVLAGALTSAPTYAAAMGVAPDPTGVAVAFALTYPFGLVGLILLLQLLPRLLGEDLAHGAQSDDEYFSSGGGRRPGASGSGPEQARAFLVAREEVCGKTLRELDLTRRTGCVISRHASGDRLEVPDGDTILELDDLVLAMGRVDELHAFAALVGPETADHHLRDSDLSSRRIEVRNREVLDRSLGELGIIKRHHCVVTRVERGEIWIEPGAEVAVCRDDVIEVVGRREDLRAVARLLGRFEPSVTETDIAVYAGGILIGILVGSIVVPVGDLHLRLGNAGGLLLVGLVLGWQHRIGPVQTYVPREARQLVRDLGILLFVGETGMGAGAGLAASQGALPLASLVAGAAVNVTAVLGALFLGRVVLRLEPLDTWGSLCGGLTSSAALRAVRRLSDSNEAAVPYAAAYAVASVLATLAGPVMVYMID